MANPGPLDRRTFVLGAASVLAGIGRRSSPQRTVFRHATIYDGTGRPPVTGDVAIGADRIEAVGPNLDRSGAVVVDLDGLALSPGFIDIHSHTDLSLFVDPNAESKVRQGVTTEVAGQDGSSIGPWSQEQFESIRTSYREQYGTGIEVRDPGGLLTALQHRPASVNLATMVGAGTVRRYVIGEDDREATPAEIERMRDAVRGALDAGACGLSTGLEYTPGAFASLAELVTLARELSGRGLPFATHMRNEDDQLFAAVEEALHIGRMAGVPVQISHLKAQGRRNWWKAEPVLAMLEQGRRDGIDVMFDRYPYVAYSTGLGSLFPVWARDGGTAAFLARLDDPAIAPRIEREVRDKIAKLGSWNAVQITSTGREDLAWAHGQRLGDLAQRRGTDPYRLLHHLTVEDDNRGGMVGFGMSEENTELLLAHPLAMICSDGGARAISGPLARGTPHPRSYGTYPRVLGYYCRDRHLMPLERAIQKMTDMPARRLRFHRRGRIAPTFAADLVVFDPVTVRDEATFAAPHRYPTGITHVVVNGTFVIREGDHTGAHPGRAVRPS